MVYYSTNSIAYIMLKEILPFRQKSSFVNAIIQLELLHVSSFYAGKFIHMGVKCVMCGFLGEP